jgi:hypothetical protein
MEEIVRRPVVFLPPHWLLEGKFVCRDLMGDAGWSSLVLWQFRPERFLLDG